MVFVCLRCFGKTQKSTDFRISQHEVGDVIWIVDSFNEDIGILDRPVSSLSDLKDFIPLRVENKLMSYSEC